MRAGVSTSAAALFFSMVMAAAEPAAAVNLVPNPSFEGYTPCPSVLPGECQSLGGSPQGPGSTCGPDACHPVAVAPASWSGIKARTN